MTFLIYFLIFLFGLAVGSFLNSVIYRLEKGESPFQGRSYCPRCRHQLNWPDLIPLLSFLILRGKCRYCRKPISWQYPLVEIATATIFLLVSLTISNIYTGVYLLLTSSFLIAIFVYDLKHYIIPDKIIYPAIILVFFYQLFGIWNLGNWNLSGIWNLGFGLLPSLFFLAIILFSQGQWMGLGDFKLAVFMGLFLGWPNILVALFLAFLSGAIIGIGLIILKKKTLKSEVPFGPFLVAGTFVALFWGQSLVNCYFNFISAY